jgi:hypothetical protein
MQVGYWMVPGLLALFYLHAAGARRMVAAISAL